MRTTVDIDDPILEDVKSLARDEGQSLGRLISDLLAQALHSRATQRKPKAAPTWIARSMGARVDLADKDAVYMAMERETPRVAPRKRRAARR
jgi:hypothetical protein